VGLHPVDPGMRRLEDGADDDQMWRLQRPFHGFSKLGGAGLHLADLVDHQEPNSALPTKGPLDRGNAYLVQGRHVHAVSPDPRAGRRFAASGATARPRRPGQHAPPSRQILDSEPHPLVPFANLRREESLGGYVQGIEDPSNQSGLSDSRRPRQ